MKIQNIISSFVGAGMLWWGGHAVSSLAASTSVVEAVRAEDAAWLRDSQAKDLEKVLTHYDENATEMFAGVPLLKGKSAIRQFGKIFFSDPNLSMTFAPSTIVAAQSEDIAYIQGTYTLKKTDPKSKLPVLEKGKYLTIYKKQKDGAWKAIEDINNADGPAVPIQ